MEANSDCSPKRSEAWLVAPQQMFHASRARSNGSGQSTSFILLSSSAKHPPIAKLGRRL
jgi:hypothetical protein